MVKLIASVLCLCIAMIPQQTKCIPNRIINPQEIVNRVNNDPKSTWKADSYGMNEFNVDQFARSHLGARVDIRDLVGDNAEERKNSPLKWSHDTDY